MDEKKLMEPDGLSVRFLKEVSDEIVGPPLTKLYNWSLYLLLNGDVVM